MDDKEKKQKLQKEFERVAEMSAQLVTDLKLVAKDLRKNEVYRVFLAAMEYPVPPDKKLTSQLEVDVYQMSIGIKEMQMKMGNIHFTLKSLESQEVSNDKSSQDSESV